eukprot:GSA25T00007053001.1
MVRRGSAKVCLFAASGKEAASAMKAALKGMNGISYLYGDSNLQNRPRILQEEDKVADWRSGSTTRSTSKIVVGERDDESSTLGTTTTVVAEDAGASSSSSSTSADVERKTKVPYLCTPEPVREFQPYEFFGPAQNPHREAAIFPLEVQVTAAEADTHVSLFFQTANDVTLRDGELIRDRITILPEPMDDKAASAKDVDNELQLQQATAYYKFYLAKSPLLLDKLSLELATPDLDEGDEGKSQLKVEEKKT